MAIPQHHYCYAAIMLIAGLGIPVMAALNSGLGVKLQSSIMAATVLFAVGLIASVTLLIAFEGLPRAIPSTFAPITSYMGGLLIVLYIFSITWISPKFGVGNAILFVLLGQIISLALIDHFSLLGAPQHPISLRRLAGLLLISIGIFLAVRR
jgi:transporter family-2 protein